MRSFLTFLTGAWLALSLAACAKTTSDSGLGTNTNWLRTCEEASDCEGDEICACGQCTEACTDSSECGGIHNEASCQPIADTVCDENVGVASACLQSCQTSSDCTALEDGLCVLGLCVPRPPPVPDAGPSEPFALTRSGAGIEIPDIYKECESHADCALVGTTCNGCCNEAAIRGDLVDTYTTNMTPACADYEGGICDCAFEDLVPRCVNNRCAAEPRAELDCYAPEDNDDHAYDPDGVGCNCLPYQDKSICTEEAALICEHVRYDVYAWIAVEDGPCEPVAGGETCEGGVVLPTAAACLETHTTCRRLDNGEYCGSD